jgi:hypothetical protein
MNVLKPSGSDRRLSCALRVIECGMRLHGSYKEIVIIIRVSSAVYESLGLTSSVEPAGCGMVLVLGRE